MYLYPNTRADLLIAKITYKTRSLTIAASFRMLIMFCDGHLWIALKHAFHWNMRRICQRRQHTDHFSTPHFSTGLWRIAENGEPELANNFRVTTYYPPESTEEIWGGEGVVAGYRCGKDDPVSWWCLFARMLSQTKTIFFRLHPAAFSTFSFSGVLIMSLFWLWHHFDICFANAKLPLSAHGFRKLSLRGPNGICCRKYHNYFKFNMVISFMETNNVPTKLQTNFCSMMSTEN